MAVDDALRDARAVRQHRRVRAPGEGRGVDQQRGIRRVHGTRGLYALGLEDALKRVQVLPSGRVIRHWSTGETWNWFDLGAATRERYGTPHVMLHRGDLHGLLADAVRAALGK